MTDRLSDGAGRTLREHVPEPPDQGALVAARSRFVDAATAATHGDGKRRNRLTALAAAAAVFAAAGVVAMLHGQPRALTFSVGHDRHAGAVAEYIAAAPAEGTPLYFSDGTALILSPSSHARVERTTQNGATVLVEDGTIDANVTHTAGSEWTFRAGPYVVHVTGTSFLLAWSARSGIDLRMRAGAVRVEGPGVPRDFFVRDHERFTSMGTPRADEPTPASSPPMAGEPVPSADAVPPSATAPDARASSGRTASRESPAATSPSAPPSVAEPVPAAIERDLPTDESWSQLVARGQYRRVLDAAGRSGTDAVLGSAGERDLEALADAARLGGERSLARQTLVTLRTRFPSTSRGMSAAFLLGRMADDGGDLASASKWYSTYLTEAPGGTFAEEALGRRMLVSRRLNDGESTRRAAEDYLARFPSGPYARIAREIVAP